MIDYTENYYNLTYGSDALQVIGRAKNVVALHEMEVPVRRADGKMATYRLTHMWLSQYCESPEDQAYACVEGSDTTYWMPGELDPATLAG